jgi:hypothetical protein
MWFCGVWFCGVDIAGVCGGLWSRVVKDGAVCTVGCAKCHVRPLVYTVKFLYTALRNWFCITEV